MRSILAGERTALNFLQRLSGVATLTRKFVDAVSGTKARVLDTRKTVPGLRMLDKYAVRCGGGQNHRLDLSDGVLIKNNHIALAGGVVPALERVHRNRRGEQPIEIEVRTPEELELALANGADSILLDNMPVVPMRQIHPGITVIAIDVGAVREPLSAPMAESGVVSGWSYAWSRVRTHDRNLASLPRILMRLTELGAGSIDDRGDLYLRPRTDTVSLMDFKAFDELIDIGFQDAEPEIAKWLGDGERF